MIKDSGERREFDTGAVRDIQEGKGRCDLLPLDIIGEIRRDDSIIECIESFRNSGDYKSLLNAAIDFGCCFFDDSVNYLPLELAKHFEEGAIKYGENNWQKGIPVHCYIDSALRHYFKFMRGDEDERHDRAFVRNLVCAAWTVKHMPELDDYSINKDEENKDEQS